jgi:hypothetical protein
MHSVGTVPMDTGVEEDSMGRQKWPVGLAEIATMFGLEKNTPTRWLYRSRQGWMDPRFPEPDGHVSRTVPFWWDSTIERWARSSGRVMVAPPPRPTEDVPSPDGASPDGTAPPASPDGNGRAPAPGDLHFVEPRRPVAAGAAP